MGSYIFILVLLVGMWFLLIRPQRRRQMESQRLLQSLAVGKEIVTAGGLYGTITALEDDEARVKIADGVEVRVAKHNLWGLSAQFQYTLDSIARSRLLNEGADFVRPGERKKVDARVRRESGACLLA